MIGDHTDSGDSDRIPVGGNRREGQRPKPTQSDPRSPRRHESFTLMAIPQDEPSLGGFGLVCGWVDHGDSPRPARTFQGLRLEVKSTA